MARSGGVLIYAVSVLYVRVEGKRGGLSVRAKRLGAKTCRLKKLERDYNASTMKICYDCCRCRNVKAPLDEMEQTMASGN